MKIFRKKKKDGLRKGAITVFLTVILVPCLVFASVFTDLSRVELAKARAVSAADLSLNAVLANYDPDLKEFYGMMASVQSPEEFMKKAEKYFAGMLKQAQVDGTQSKLFMDAVKSLISGESGKPSNFLKMSFNEEPTITAAENGKLTNPVLLEDQIVEFMKYRGIPVIVKKLLDRFTNFSNQSEEVRQAEEYEPTAEAKQKYSEAEGKLMEAIFNTYYVLFKYQEVVKQYEDLFGISGNELASHFESLESDVNKIWNDFKKANELATLRYIATDGLKLLKVRPSTDLNIANATEEKKIKDEITTEENGEYYLTAEIYDDIMRDYDKAYQKVTSTAEQIAQKIGPVNEKIAGVSDVNGAIYAIEVQKALTVGGKTLDEDFGKQVEEFVEMAKKLTVIYEFKPKEGESLPDEWKKEVKNKLQKAKYFANNLVTDNGVNFSSATAKYVELVVSKNVVQQVNDRSYTFSSEFMGEEVTLEKFTNKVSDRYSKEISYLTTMIGYLNVVIDGGNIEIDGKYKDLTKLQDLRKLVDEYVSTKNDWSDKAHGIPGNPHGKEDIDEIEGIKKNEKLSPDSPEAQIANLEKSITIEALNELKQRLQHSVSLLEDAKKALEKQTYGGLPLSEVSTGEILIERTKSVVPADTSQITMSIQSGKNFAASYNDTLVKPGQNELYKNHDISRTVTGNDPNLDNVNPTDHIPPLYKVLKKHFKEPKEIEDNVDHYKKQNEAFKKQGEEQKKSALKYDSYLVYPGTGTLPEEPGNTGILSQFRDLFQTVKQIAEGGGSGFAADLRDKVFVIEYIMSMFSHATYSNEAWYAREENSNKEYMHAKDWDNLKGRYADKFGEVDLYNFTDNVSLTNQLISNKNNALYLAEVEYCLYGKPTVKDNLEASFGDIFKIRFASNTLSGFINFWNENKNKTAATITGIAMAIQYATQGIVPAVLTKSILILALSTMESASDLEVIKKGLPVTFYKVNDSKWKFAINPAPSTKRKNDNGKIDDTGGDNPEDEYGLRYSDYMYIFLIQQSLGNSSYTTLLTRIGKLVEGNMKLMTGKDWKIDNCIMYYQLQGQVKVEPLMLTLPLIQSFDAKGKSAKDVIKTTKWAEFTIKQIKGYS